MTSLSEVFPNFKQHIQFEGFDGNFDSDSEDENNGNVLLPRIDTTHVPEVPGEVQDTDDGPIIMCGKLMGGWSFEKDDLIKAKKITELVKDVFVFSTVNPPEKLHSRLNLFGM